VTLVVVVKDRVSVDSGSEFTGTRVALRVNVMFPIVGYAIDDGTKTTGFAIPSVNFLADFTTELESVFNQRLMAFLMTTLLSNKALSTQRARLNKLY
jgi:hypothetical protein